MEDSKIYIFIALCTLLLVGVIVTNVRVNKLTIKTKKLQKHVLYQQNLIEKSLQSSTSTGDSTSTVLVPPPSLMEEEEEETKRETVPERPPERPNPINNILPLVGSLVNMMGNPGIVDTSTVSPPVVVEEKSSFEMNQNKEFDEEKMMVEIQNELNELKLTPKQRDTPPVIEEVEAPIEVKTEVPV